ncbi:MAG: GTP 3',8-cyclase MoaA [Lachnospiraceae bacterium]|nr:GTP 3',8-cyclase MoaA [Lachnospiraceae bacterium]
MQDRFGRKIDYLRISITDKCNLRCKYCMPSDIGSVPMGEILTYEEIERVVRAAAGLGIKKIKLTGGEPLIRRDCCILVAMLKDIPGIDSVTLTTNGVLLYDRIGDLKNAGIDGINISIDTLDKKRYEILTGKDELDKVLMGLEAAAASGIPVKINAVSVDWPLFDPVYGCASGDGSLFCDTEDLISLTKDDKVDVRFIEMMPIGAGKDFPAIPHDILIPYIFDRYPGIKPEEERHGNGPASYYVIPGHEGAVGFISALNGMFCENCNRLRLTSLGFVKSCLCYDTGVDIKETLRSGADDDEIDRELRSKIEKAVDLKPDMHSFSKEDKITEKRAMSKIGG